MLLMQKYYFFLVVYQSAWGEGTEGDGHWAGMHTLPY